MESQSHFTWQSEHHHIQLSYCKADGGCKKKYNSFQGVLYLACWGVQHAWLSLGSLALKQVQLKWKTVEEQYCSISLSNAKCPLRKTAEGVCSTYLGRINVKAWSLKLWHPILGEIAFSE